MESERRITMIGALSLLLNGKLEGDFDCNHFRLLNLDTSNLFPPIDFPKVEAHKVLIGPAAGEDFPTFRLATASEFGAQPLNNNLTVLAGLNITNFGVQILQANNLTGGQALVGITGFGGTVLVLTPPEARTLIQAQPVSDNLTILSGIAPSESGKKFLAYPDVLATTYPQVVNGVVFPLTGDQLAGALGLAPPPFLDTNPLVRNDTSLKTFAINLGGLGDNTMVTMTSPPYDFTPATIDGNENLLNKRIKGLDLQVGTSTGTAFGDPVHYTQTPGPPFGLSLVAVSPGEDQGSSLILRTTGPTDVTFPVSGTLLTADDADAFVGSFTRGGSITTETTIDLSIEHPFVFYTYEATIGVGGSAFNVDFSLPIVDVTPGSVMRIIINFAAGPNATARFISGEALIIQSVSSDATAATRFIFDTYFDAPRGKWNQSEARYDGALPLA